MFENQGIFHRLPEELVQDVLERLDRSTLCSLSLTSRWYYQVALQLLWREVELTDCRTKHEDTTDEHDDTPLIKKLLILATNPRIASYVHVLTHRCHLPPPAIFNELPRTPFNSQTLSTDPRTIRLAQLAARQMTRVHTLRIVFGHPTLNDALLRCFFDKNRSQDTPVRRLWLENCRISAGCQLRRPEFPYDLPTELSFGGLQSLRLRRLPLRPEEWIGFTAECGVYCRGYSFSEMQDSGGGFYTTSMNDFAMEQDIIHSQSKYLLEPRADEARPGVKSVSPLESLYGLANEWDDEIYRKLLVWCTPEQQKAVNERHEPSWMVRSQQAARGWRLDPVIRETEMDHMSRIQRERLPSSTVALDSLRDCSQTLTSLSLDWLFTMPTRLYHVDDVNARQRWMDLFIELFSLRFPHLRAFQFRNAVVQDTLLPFGLYLFDRAHMQTRNLQTVLPDFHMGLPESQHSRVDEKCLTFMEAHPDLRCLAWPMDQFFSAKPSARDIASRVDAVITNLGRTLVELRVDTLYSGVGEAQTEENEWFDRDTRDRRRRFIEEFASKMQKVEVIKIEGGVPRDERREVLRALRTCPLNKVVLIGVCCTLGNTWGELGRDLGEPLSNHETEYLEAENIHVTEVVDPVAPDTSQGRGRFQAVYGWPPGPPLIDTVAFHHASTITELKFCGYKGAPVLLSPTAITTPLLSALKRFHKLESLIMSMWLSTIFEHSSRDSEIISYWNNTRTPSSTALVRITDEEPEGWEKELLTKYAPNALAWRITNFLGPFLSEEAKTRRGGVHVRASFCVGDFGGIYDMDLRIGKGSVSSDICLEFEGPRDEFEAGRRRSKLDSRRWF